MSAYFFLKFQCWLVLTTSKIILGTHLLDQARAWNKMAGFRPVCVKTGENLALHFGTYNTKQIRWGRFSKAN